MMKAQMRTYQSRLHIETGSIDLLGNYAVFFSGVEHHLLKEICRGNDPTSLKTPFLRKFGMTARQINACFTMLQGKIDSLKECKKLLASNLEEKIGALEARIKKMTNLRSLHQAKRRLHHLKAKLQRANSDSIQICFGSRKLFRAQFALKENGYKSHEEWKLAWDKARSSEFFVLGSKDETGGNQSCVATLQEDKSLTLRLRLPRAFEESHGKYLVIPGVRFAYGHQEIAQALVAGQAISYRFKRDEKGWRVFLSTQVLPKPIITKIEKGVIGVDINADHLAIAETDHYGNIVAKKSIPCSLYGLSGDQAKARIGDACKEAVLMAEASRKPLILEKLEFSKKKASLREQAPKFARMLSSFAYGCIISHLKAGAYRRGVEVKEVNPAYTSLIGRAKFALRYGLSIHIAAAFVIGRRALKFSEALGLGHLKIPDGRGAYVALSLPARNRGQHVWAFLRQVNKKMRAALAAHFRTMRNRSMTTIKTGHETHKGASGITGAIPVRESLALLLS